MEQKTIDLFTGSEEGANFSVRIKVGIKERVGKPYYWVALAEKVRTRAKDRAYFKKYGGGLLEKYEIHHEWEKGGVCFLLTHAEHLKRR